MAKRAQGRRWKRWPRRLLLGLTVLLLLLLAFAAFLVGTTPGGRMALSLAQGFLPDDLSVEVAGFDGRLIDRFDLLGVEMRLPAVEIAADRVVVDWRPRGLLRKQVLVNAALVDGVDVRIVEAPTDSTRGESEAPADSLGGPPVPELPVHIRVDSVGVTGAALWIGDSAWFSDGRIVLAGELEDYRLTFSGRVDIPDLPATTARVSGTGSSTEFKVDSVVADALGGRIAGSGEVAWWPAVGWTLEVEGEQLEPSDLLPYPDEWPGRLSFAAASTGRITDEGAVELDAVVDTLFGELRGERVDGRFETHVRGDDIELPAARIRWGPASVIASGTASATLDLDFEATLPDLELVLPGASGSLAARGRTTGPRETPRIRVTFEADSVSAEALTADEVNGDVDLDLAGPLSASLVARGLSIAGRGIDSVDVILSGVRGSHSLEVSARGPDGELDLSAEGGLDASNAWTGTVASLRLAADTMGSWSLADPVELAASSATLRIGEACLESRPARICVEGETGSHGIQIVASIDSLDARRLQPLMPENVTVATTLFATAVLEVPRGGEITGQVSLGTDTGSLMLPVRGEVRTLRFEPIALTASSDSAGLHGELDLHLADSTGARVLAIGGRVESPVTLRSADDLGRLAGQPASAHLEVEAGDLLLLTDDLLRVWDVSGSFRAVADLEADAEGRLSGAMEATTESLVLQNTVRGRGWTLTVDPARVMARVGPDGLTGDLDLSVDVAGMGSLLTATGQLALPELTTLDVDPETQPVEGSLDVVVTDLSIFEAFLIDISEASGIFELHTRVAGTLAAATVEGDARVADGRAVLPALGLDLNGIELMVSGRPDGGVEIDGKIHSGPGLLTIHGRSERYPSAENPSVIQLSGERFQVLDFPEVQLDADPTINLTFDGSTLLLEGRIGIPYGRLGFPEIPAAAVTPSEDVVIVGDTVAAREPPVPFGADITVTLGEDVFFSGFGLTANLRGELNIAQDPGEDPRGRGELRLVNGIYRALGQELRIDPGRLLFSGSLDDPGVEARAFVRATDGTEAGFRIGGTVQNLDVTTYSVPPKSDSDVMAYILFGRPMSQTSGSEGNEASNAAAILGANMLAMSLAPSLGLDEARIETGSSQNKAQFVVGKYLSPRLFLGYGVGIYEPISTLRVRYLLSAKWSIEAITGDQQSTDLLYRIERGGRGEERAEEVAPGGETSEEQAVEAETDAPP
jgi:autotransporter translocation and assembly factor TamB